MDGFRLARSQGLAIVLLFLTFEMPQAFASIIEISGLVAYSQSKIDAFTYTRENRYTAELAWHFTKITAIELSYAKSYNQIAQTVNTTSILFPSITESVTNDETVYSVSWVQSLLPSDFLIQPYFKVGVGRLIQKQSVQYSAFLPNQEFDQTADTGVGGAGVKLMLTKNLSIKAELVSYMPNFRFSTWKDSQMISIGLSWMF